jgi:uncharacterized membrane protein YedE/YeeE
MSVIHLHLPLSLFFKGSNPKNQPAVCKGGTTMKEKYMSPYLTGLGLGIVLLATFFLMGRGLGASGAMMRSVVAVEKAVAPGHTNNNTYLQRYGGGEKGKPLKSWLVFEVLGMFIGATISGVMAGRAKAETFKGPRITQNRRLLFALTGGVIFGIGTRIARGCTSGQALTGGATLALGSWVIMLCFFAGAYAMAYFVRKQWI